ncbi:hypothetical protein PHJA_002383000 [Phtheirospermum japonicum]|uniref:F-box domain-containing protein n=1 Tax=Phtheirospermum japonicum TaxID=374723 RepID=A0A830CTN8_9LAMI|nr:hypothetical protein PHJA_002383000 [Phtheirospermum japonicum]
MYNSYLKKNKKLQKSHVFDIIQIAVGGNCAYASGKTRPHYFPRCNKTIPEANIESLPDDVIFDILVRVPAQDIYDSARLVSPKWHKMIRTHDFARAHLQQSIYGLLIQDRGAKYDRPIFIETREGRIEISNFNHKFTCAVLSSCNGLVLDHQMNNNRYLYISNPATKRRFALPPFITEKPPYRYAAIAYAAAAMEYKVVRTFCPYDGNRESRGCAILTVGVDKDWARRVNIQHLSLKAKALLERHPLATQGFVYWAGMEYVLSLNVETEIITQFHAPPLCHHDGETKLLYNYLPMGSHLSLLIGDYNRFSWEVWVMKPETGEWTNMTSIKLEAEKCTFEGVSALNCRLVPVGWSKLGEVLFFRVRNPTKFCIAYNVHTREVDSFELEYYKSRRYIVHRNSLIWLDGC